MATKTFKVTTAGSASSSFVKNGRLKVEYSAGGGAITITEIYGYRTDGYRSYASSNKSVTINGTSKSLSHYVDFKASGSDSSCTAFGLDDITLYGEGNQTVSIKMPTNSGLAYSGCTFSDTIDAGYGNRSVVVRISNMDTAGNYGASWVWINTSVAYGSSVEYWGYGSGSTPDNNEYNVVHYANSSVTSNVDTTVYASRRTWYLDINGNLDGTDSGGIAGYGTCNVDVGGVRKATNATDYYTAHYYGLSYSVSATASTGHTYNGVTGDALSGTINGAKNVRLKFTTNTYNVAYNANGGSSTPTTLTGKKYGSAVTLSNAISRANSDSNITITVTYNANGGTGAPSASTGTAVNTTPYTFNKWALNSASGTAYAAGASFTIPASNSTMYATWTTGTTTRKSNPSITLSSTKPTKANSTVSSYVVTYNANGGTCGTASQTATKTRAYTFSKWTTGSDGSGTAYNAGTAYTFSANTTIYAQFTSSDSGGSITSPTPSKANTTATRTVTFNANGGSCSTASLNSTQTTTYTQNGWWTAASGGTKVVNANTSYTPSATQTVYAQYTSNAGSWSSITLPTPTRPDYIFKGWATTASATEGITGSYTPTGNVTLYATWVEDQAKIWAKNALPSTYTAVEYINTTASTTEAFIDTGYIPKSLHTKYEIGFMKTADNGAWSQIINNEADVRFGVVCSRDTSTQAQYACWVGSSSTFQTVTGSIANNTYYDIILDKTGIKMNGTLNAFTGLPLDATGQWPACINRRYLSATTHGGGVAVGRWYYVRIYEDGNIKRNFIPCSRNSDGVVGMYELCQDKFYPSTSTTAFSKGNNSSQNTGWIKGKAWAKTGLPEAYQQVDYITLTGTQHIPLGYAFNPTTDGYSVTYQASTIEQNGMILANAYASSGPYIWCYYYKDGNGMITYANTSNVGQVHNTPITRDLLKHTYGYDRKKVYFDGSMVADWTANTFATASPYAQMIVGHYWTNNDKGDYHFKGNIYEVVLTRNGVEQMHLFPCYRKSDNVIGLYDVITNAFFVNGGTGTLGKGSNNTGVWQKAKKVWVKESLPSGYQEVDYITTNGNQYIDTQVIPDLSTTAIKVVAEKTSGTSGFLFGSRTASITSQYAAYLTDTTMRCDYNSSQISISITNSGKREYALNVNTFTVDGNLACSNTLVKGTSNTSILLGFNQSADSIYKFQGKIYNCKIYNNGILIKNYIPCYRTSDNVIGMYDTVNNAFIVNAGTGTFGKGSNVSGHWVPEA